MHTFVVNLKHHTERRASIQAQLAKTTLDYQFIEAVNGAELSDQQLRQQVLDYPACMLTKGEIGCALSHLKIYQKMLDEHISHALILEDDAIIPENIAETTTKLVQLDNHKANVYLLNKVHSYIENKKLADNVYQAYDTSGTYGYLINNRAAKKLLTVLQPLRYEADKWCIFTFYNYINLYCIIPHIIKNGDATGENSILTPERSKNAKQRLPYRKRIQKQEKFYQFYRIRNLLNKHLRFKITKYTS